MARRTGSLFVTEQTTPWAGASGANLTALASAAGGALTVPNGLPTTFDADRYIESGIFNQLINLLWDFGIDVGGIGILEWHTDQPYRIYARVIGSDGNIYKAVQENTGQDPTTDTSNTYWTREGAATASDIQVEAGSSSTLAVTPSGLLSLFKATLNDRWKATTSKHGLTLLANSTEVDAASLSTKVVTPASLRRNLLAPLASPTFTGSPKAPTQSDSDNSTNLATTEFVKTAVAGAGASYVHLATAPSASSSGLWTWGALQSNASNYVARYSSNQRLRILGTAPRGFTGILFEVYAGQSFYGRILYSLFDAPQSTSLGAGAAGFTIVRLNESTNRIVAIPDYFQSAPGQGETGVELAVRWQSGQTTGYECRAYAVVI